MAHRRRILIGLVATAAAVLAPVAPAFAAPAAPAAVSAPAAVPAPVVAIGDCENPSPTDTPADGYAPPTRCELGVARAEAICLAAAPALSYAVEPVGTSSTTLTITWHNPGGADLVQSGLPLSGQVYWPGTVVVDGVVTDWPGWTQLPDGSWTEHDAYDYTRPEVEVTFEVNPSATTVVSYPPASAVCANPPQSQVAGVVVTSEVLAAPDAAAPEDVRAASAVLAVTGADSTPLLVGAGLMLLAGGLLVAIPLRRRHRAG
ncbi:LPXTG cell wall anchor domain-containing protein [Cellulomonas sp. ACRRI]|uniref:LPXTG cell wall anchor domain-containing protein n=1 Tax=Cellulomonas sp. ACRRI TaxID=2918188 RepID=UPI001EF21CED|nr:LPXTG cell wall anchor domain-containing protein [Cellulomonas sp. ACRRI]MCG7286794.1 LPXTG cell wall anchor domain-containing protein [Cellulomonas sp. ACRRI]